MVRHVPEHKGSDDVVAKLEDGPDAYLRVYFANGVPTGRPAWFWVASDGHQRTSLGYKLTARKLVELLRTRGR